MADQMKHEQNTPKAPDTTSGNVLTTTNERRAELNKKLSVKAVDMEGDMEKVTMCVCVRVCLVI